MDWIAKLAAKPPRNIIQQVESLTLQQQQTIRRHTSFNRESFKSRHLPQTFRNYHFTDISSPNQDSPDAPLIEFMLMLPTQYEAIQIYLTISVDLNKQFIRYSSYPAKHSQMLSFTNQQVVALARFFSFHLNSRLSVGWLSIDPESGCLTYKHANNSLGFLEKRIEKVPEDLTEFLSVEVKQIEKNWKYVLLEIFALLNISERRIISHPFWNYATNKTKPKNHYESPQFILLSQYVKHSFIEYPQMFDETLSGATKRIRSKFLSRQQKNKKYLVFKNNQDSLSYCSQPLNKQINNLLEIYYSKKVIDQEIRMVKKQLDQRKVAELSTHLAVDRYEPKTEIYSELMIRSVQKEEELSRSAFSQLKLLLIEGKKTQDKDYLPQKIVSKQTDPHRHINQSEILKYIGQGKSYFITRYFSCGNRPKQILLEYCQQKSINSYIATNRQIISFETKIVLLNRIALGVRFLRDYGVHHNDLKPENVLLKIVGNRANNNFLLTRLIDFGESYSKYQRDLVRRNWYHRGWTIPYAPPEQVKYSKYSEKTDIFSLGVILYEFVFGPFPVQTFRRGKQLYMKEQNYRRLCAMAPQKCRDFSCPKLMQLVYTLFLRCIDPNPEHRPSIDWVCIILKDIVMIAEKISFF